MHSFSVRPPKVEMDMPTRQTLHCGEIVWSAVSSNENWNAFIKSRLWGFRNNEQSQNREKNLNWNRSFINHVNEYSRRKSSKSALEKFFCCCCSITYGYFLLFCSLIGIMENTHTHTEHAYVNSSFLGVMVSWQITVKCLVENSN